ncbi:hypothetical protein QW71_23625 [Paenibacillus sp. IHB B 3415]|uniref:hypothetical protein n=1 Tax=Paenibacillus sp. IHB B 3415 TaxID=867080 RepID=UPI000575B70F|nr:hypothetical protein [Paenibacillus sp. IHB B 3415]KHL93429.1 hypothetical protein QW71_23625 [Paenibacillus sp. IHB B 3415]
MKRRLAGMLAAVLTAGTLLAGCSAEQNKKEAGSYTMQAYQDGTMLAYSQGKGLDGRFRKAMRRAFANEQLALTDEKFTEDNRGNTSYQYLINNQPAQNITLHVFTSRPERVSRITDWYGGMQLAETSGARTEVYNKDNTSLVYTSMGKEKGKYSKKVKDLFSGLLEHLGTHAH